jgi:hypothetical protein
MANEQNLTPFKKGEVHNPNGRPKKIENVLRDYFLAETNIKLSKSQVEDIIKNVLSKTRAELMDLAKNDELPFWISLIAKKAARDYDKGSIHILDVLFDRVYGKPKETADVNQTVQGKVEITLDLGK